MKKKTINIAFIIGIVLSGLLFISLYKVIKLVKIHNFLENIQFDALQCRRYEKDFLSRKQTKLVKLFKIYSDRLVENLNSYPDNNLQQIQTIKNEHEKYKQAFLHISQKLQTIGLTENDNLRKEARNAAHKLENIFIKNKKNGLTEKLLQCRRNEKDFYLRKSLKYEEKFKKNIEILNLNIKKSNLPRNIKNEALKLLGTYKNIQLKIFKLHKEVGLTPDSGLRKIMRKHRHNIEKMNYQLEKVIHKNRKTFRSIIFSSLFMLILFSILLFMLVKNAIKQNKLLKYEIKQKTQLSKELEEHKKNLEKTVEDKTKELVFEKNKAVTTLRSIGDGVIVTDHNGNVTLLNKVASDLTGWTEQDAIGKNVTEIFRIINADTGLKIENPVDIVLKKGKVVGLANHTVLISKQNVEYHIADSAAPIFDTDNRITGIVLVFHDVTEKYRKEKERIKLQEQLSHRDKMDTIGRLAGGIAHDFNNMLGGIMGAAQILQVQADCLNKENSELVDVIIKASSRASELTSKLLTFSRKGTSIKQDIEIHSIINDTILILSKTIDKNINIKFSPDAGLHTVKGNETALQNSFINISINAAHAMQQGGDLLFTTENIFLDQTYCKASSFDITPGNYIKISIRDTGTGMSQEIMNKIFEPFFTTKEQGKGTGLGLASVYGTVQDHSGAITVYSEEGKGSVFHIYLPVSGEKNAETNAKNSKEPYSEPGKTGKIILVDDEEIIRITGRAILKRMGYEVMTFDNGPDAIMAFEKQHHEIDLVITDMIMPGMNGRELFHKLRQIDKNCKIILSSGFTRDEDLADLKKEGLSGFISKPFRIEELSILLREILD